MPILPTDKNGASISPGNVPASMRNQTIRPRTETDDVAEKERVRQMRLGNIKKAAEGTKSWNPVRKIGSFLKQKALTKNIDAPITKTERQLALGPAIKPLIEDELEAKYAAHLPYKAPAPSAPTSSGAGAGLLQNKPISGPVRPLRAPVQEAAPKGPVRPSPEQIKREAQDTADEIVIDNLRQIVKKPSKLDRLNQTTDALSRGILLGVDSDFRDERVKEAEEREYPRGGAQKVVEGALEFGALLVPYTGIEMGAVKIGNSLRSVKAVDKMYEAYPYLTRTAVANLSVTAGDAAIRMGTGQEYTARDFVLNIAMQGVFDKALGTQKRRIMTHVENEVRNLENQLGRQPEAHEILERMAGMRVPDTQFTYGHWFAEHRLAYRSGIDPSDATPKKGIPGLDFSAPPPEPGDGQMNAFGEDKPTLFTGGQIPEMQPTPATGNTVNVADVKTDPKRFQFRNDVDPAFGFQESNVAGILNDQGFDPKQVRPLEIARIDETGEEVLLNGHNTLEILKRQGIESADARFIDFATEKEAIEYARKANLVSKAPEILQRVTIAKQMAGEGRSLQRIASELGRVKQSEVQKLLNIGELAPEIQRQVEQGIVTEDLAGILGGYVRTLNLSPGNQEQLVQLVKEDKFTPAGLRAWLDIMGKHSVQTTQIQGLFGTEEFQAGAGTIIQKVMRASKDVDAVIDRINKAKKLPDMIPASALKKMEKERENLLKKKKVLEFLLLKKSGAQAPTPPKGVSPKFIEQVQSEVFGVSTPESNTSLLPNLVENSKNNALPTDSGNFSQESPLRMKNLDGSRAPSSSRSTRYVSPSYSMTSDVDIDDDEYVTSILAASKENFPIFKADVEEAIGAPLTSTSGVKGEESLRGKTVRYRAQRRDIREIADVIRGTTVVPEGEIYDRIDRFKKSLEAKGFKILKESDYFKKPDNGYRGYNIKLEQPNGQRAELQVHTEDSLALREKLHGRYEKYRNIDGRKITKDLEKEIRKYNEETARIGDETWGNRNGGNGGPPLKPPFSASDDIPPEEIPGLRVGKETSDEARRTLNTVIHQHPDLLYSRTRGIVSDAEAVENAAQLGITKEYLLDLPVGTTLTKEQRTAAARYVSAHGQDVDKLRVAAALESQVGEATTAQKEYATAVFEHAKLRAVMKGVASEAGRSLQAHKILLEPLTRIERDLNQIIATSNKKDAEAIAKRLAQVDPNDEEEMLKVLTDFTQPGWLDMLVEFSTAAKLWRPTTHVVNLTSNSIYNLGTALFRIPVAGVDLMRSAVTGTARERFLVEAAKDMKGMLGKGAKEAFYIPFGGNITAEAEGALHATRGSLGEVWKSLLDEKYVPGGTMEDAIGRMPAIRGTSGNKYIDAAVDATGKVVRTPFRLLNAGDVAFRTMAHAGEMGALVARRVKTEGLSGEAAVKRFAELMQNAPDDIIKEAGEAAKRRVFQQDLTGLAKHIESIRGIPIVGPIIRLTVLPFLKTPANLIKMGFNGVNPFLLARGIKAGGGESSEAMTRFAIGATTSAFLTWYALEGRLTGSPPKEKKLRDELYAKGWLPFSVRVGEKYYSYDRMGPFDQAFRNAAAIADAYRESGGIPEEMAIASVRNVIVGTMDRSYIKGMYETLNAVFDPDRYGENWIKQFATGMIPFSGLSAAATSFTDVDDEGRQILREATNMTEYLKARIPGLAPTLKPRVDESGRIVKRRGSPLERFLSPVVSSDADLSIGEIEQMRKDSEDMKDLRKQSTVARSELKSAAMQTLAAWSQLPKEVRLTNYNQLMKENPDLGDEVKDMLKRRARGYTFRDEQLLSLTVRDRATMMIRFLKEAPKGDRALMWGEWKKKGVMSDQTEKELKKLLLNRGSTSSSSL